VDVDKQLLSELAGGDNLPDDPLPIIWLPGVPLPDASLHDIPLPGTRPEGFVGEVRTCPRLAEEAMVVESGLGLGSCLVCLRCSSQCMSGFDYYTRRKVFESLRVYFLYCFYIGFILFIVLWDIAHAVFLQLLAYREPHIYGVEAEWISQVSWKYCELTPTRLLRLTTNRRPFLLCILHYSRVVQDAREDPISVAPNLRAETSSPQIAGDLNISNYTILNTIKLHARRFWLFTARSDALNMLGVVNPTLTKFQSMA